METEKILRVGLLLFRFFTTLSFLVQFDTAMPTLTAEQLFAQLSVPADYRDFFSLTEAQRSGLIRECARYCPKWKRVYWSCCGSSSKFHRDRTSVRKAANCTYIRNHGCDIQDVPLILGFDEKGAEQQKQAEIARLAQRVSDLEILVRESVVTRSAVAHPVPSPSLHAPASPSVILRDPFVTPSIKVEQKGSRAPVQPKRSEGYGFNQQMRGPPHKKTLDEICRENTGCSLHPSNDADQCRWPEPDLTLKEVGRCSNKTNSQGDICAEHAMLVAFL
jgi:hypothetical protein